MKKKFAFIFGAAFLIRLISLNQSLWLDEAITAKVVRQFSFFEISTLFSPGDFHPPLYYIFLKLWTNVFGYSEISLRIPSVLFSLLTGHVVFLIGSRLRSRQVGMWAAILYLFNPLVIYYSQEARMYSMVTFLLTFALFFGLNILELDASKKKKNIFRQILSIPFQILRMGMHHDESTMLSIKNKAVLVFFFNLALVLALFTFYGSIFFILAILLVFFIRKKYKQMLISTACLILTFLLMLPLFKEQLSHAPFLSKDVANWSQVLGAASFKNLMLIPIKFSIGRISFYPKILYYVIAGLWTSFVFSFALLGFIKERMLGLILVLPVALGFLVSTVSPLLQYFRFLYLVPVLSLLVALGVEEYMAVKHKKGFFSIFRRGKQKKLMYRVKENAIYEILIGVFLFWSLLYLLFSAFHREDWKTMSKHLPDNRTIYMILPSSDPLLYYEALSLKELRNIEKEQFFEKDTYIVPYTVPIYGFDYEKILHEKGCYVKEKKTYRQIYFERWNCGRIS
ncbi:MAG: glycosyltransferase family 39 protein [Patescibacteria group bacterium]